MRNNKLSTNAEPEMYALIDSVRVPYRTLESISTRYLTRFLLDILTELDIELVYGETELQTILDERYRQGYDQGVNDTLEGIEWES